MHSIKSIALIITILVPFSVSTENCEPTPNRTTGTHYKPVTEQKINVGKGMPVRGQVQSFPDCTPVANAKIAHWQGGEKGRYVDELRAYMFTDDQGRYEFETEWPNMPSPHIHFIVTAEGHGILKTQWIGSERQTEINFDLVLPK